MLKFFNVTRYDGLACQRSVCPDHCNYRGACFPEKMLADKAGRDYSLPWDAMKIVGCLCDKGFRGPACELQVILYSHTPMCWYSVRMYVCMYACICDSFFI